MDEVAGARRNGADEQLGIPASPAHAVKSLVV
jgi:hypothetical protein